MKFRIIYQLFAILLIFIVLQSRSSGPGSQQSLEVTGAPGSTGNPGTCGNLGCHGGGNFNATLNLTILDGVNPVTSYTPNKSYTLKIVNSASSGNPAGYGFQAVSLNNSNRQAGSWGALPSGVRGVTLSNRNYIEQSVASNSNTYNIPWVAPAAGTGLVTIYAAGLASNLNGSTNGDQVVTASLSVTEGSLTSAYEQENLNPAIKIFSNPVGNELNLEILSDAAGIHEIGIYNLNGSELKKERISLSLGSNKISISLQEFETGLYVFRLRQENAISALRFFKSR
jgi:hypothetical protein